MITRSHFISINDEVKASIEKTFADLKSRSIEDYVLFLANGEYRKEYDKADQFIGNPNVIDDRIGGYEDETRLKFLSEFLSLFYAFPKEQEQTDDNPQRMNMELMIYTHLWEAKPFLKQLFRLSHLNNHEPYQWEVIVEPMGKHNFIRNDIRKIFENRESHLAEIIRKGFHTSLRNAFAHSEYSFDTMNNNRRINLYNWGGEDWELRSLNFDEWSIRFVYSALLSYHLLDVSYKRRIKIIEDLGTDVFPIKLPNKANSFDIVKIQYRNNGNAFNFVPRESNNS